VRTAEERREMLEELNAPLVWTTELAVHSMLVESLPLEDLLDLVVEDARQLREEHGITYDNDRQAYVLVEDAVSLNPTEE